MVMIAALGQGLLLTVPQAWVCNLQVKPTVHQNPCSKVLTAVDSHPEAPTLEVLSTQSGGISQPQGREGP